MSIYFTTANVHLPAAESGSVTASVKTTCVACSTAPAHSHATGVANSLGLFASNPVSCQRELPLGLRGVDYGRVVLIQNLGDDISDLLFEFGGHGVAFLPNLPLNAQQASEFRFQFTQIWHAELYARAPSTRRRKLTKFTFRRMLQNA